jgi:Holliday junction resolvase RusA-like endonuclease
MSADTLPLAELSPRRLLRVTVLGIPQPQGSKDFKGMRGGKPILVESNDAKLQPWRRAIATAARTAWGQQPAYDGPVELRIQFTLTRPASAPVSWLARERWRLPSHGVDLDKLVRAVGDSITRAGVWVDDARVVRLSAAKVYAGDPQGLPEPGARIEIWTAP